MGRRRKRPWLSEAGKARWKDVPQAARSKHAKAAAKARWKRVPETERSEALRQVVMARWAKWRKRHARD